MHTLIFCLAACVIVPIATAQNFNFQPQVGDYGPNVAQFTPDYGYYGSSSPYYSQNYAPSYNVRGVTPFSIYGNYPDSSQGPLSGQSYSPNNFAYRPNPNLNNVFQSNPYPYFFNRGPNYDPSIFYNAPNNPVNLPRPQYENYAPTFTTPLESPLQDTVSPIYQPPLAPIPSEAPNVIREEPDGKHMTVAGTTNPNRTFLTPEFNYKQIVVPDIIPTNSQNIVSGEGFGENFLQNYPQANISEPLNPDFRAFLNPQYPIPSNYPPQLPSTYGSDQTLPASQNPLSSAQLPTNNPNIVSEEAIGGNFPQNYLQPNFSEHLNPGFRDFVTPQYPTPSNYPPPSPSTYSSGQTLPALQNPFSGAQLPANNPNIVTEDSFGGNSPPNYPQANLRESLNPDVGAFLNPQYPIPSNYPPPLPSTYGSGQTLSASQIPLEVNSGAQLPTNNPNTVTEEAFGGNYPQNYPQANLSEPLNPDFRQFLNPAYPQYTLPSNIPSRYPSSIYPGQTNPISRIPFQFNSGVDQPQFPEYPNQVDGQTFVSNRPPLYPTPPTVLPDISLSSSPQNTGNPSYASNSNPSFGANPQTRINPLNLQPLTPIRPNVAYEAPGHTVSS